MGFVWSTISSGSFWNPPGSRSSSAGLGNQAAYHQSTNLYPWEFTHPALEKRCFQNNFYTSFVVWTHVFDIVSGWEDIRKLKVAIYLCVTCAISLCHLFVLGVFLMQFGRCIFLKNCGSIKAQETSKALTSLTANDSPNLNLIITNPKIKMKRWM